MKIILIVFVIIPFILFAQSKKGSTFKPPLIESITSDTVKGTFYQVLFSYDKINRVISITNKECKITNANSKTRKQVEQIIRQQIYEYKGTELLPFSRKIESYEIQSYEQDTAKWYLASQAQQYFLYNNGQRIGDSTLLLERDGDSENWDEKAKKRIGFLKQTSNSIYHKMDLTKPYNDPISSFTTNIYTDELKLTSRSNVSYESSEYLYGNHGGGSTYYTFSKFDAMLNPLKDLNIASILVDEKVCLYDGQDFESHNKDWKIFRGGHYGNVDISWYFVNQNNPLNYFATVNDQSSPFKSIFNLRYTYNQFKQPIYAKTQEKLVFNKGGKFYSKHQTSITFKYKK